ncbi:hypothetical protein LU604_03795 [Erwinia tracheiphila]|uniref:Uncharacterized protein n=1 Tax=Erwinia tracheiphila TaxID=65700 RepID=A0A345CUJ9_9GAMM|nr:hypothetical protein [Erwinia tracheiphila]AXF77116.1 hypothetical protein AV903_15560 [Erwinia tracheiphila]UIA84198.1 hypothetical protein LU604_03795 [Erwinia tracheiphila]UIA92779.1 hypothetical protein LU632_03745 [Erwinia tracheiphila]
MKSPLDIRQKPVSSLAENKPTCSEIKNVRFPLLKNLLSKINQISNSFIHFSKRGEYTVKEMQISSPTAAWVSVDVFKEVPEKLKPYCKNRHHIVLDNNYMKKQEIRVIYSISCASACNRLPENPASNLELIAEGVGFKEYRIKDRASPGRADEIPTVDEFNQLSRDIFNAR